MTDTFRVVVHAADIDLFAATNGLLPTGDPLEFWFGKGTDTPAIVAFTRGINSNVWTGTVFVGPYVSTTAVAEGLARLIAHQGRVPA
jgi:hypothetical protein